MLQLQSHKPPIYFIIYFLSHIQTTSLSSLVNSPLMSCFLMTGQIGHSFHCTSELLFFQGIPLLPFIKAKPEVAVSLRQREPSERKAVGCLSDPLRAQTSPEPERRVSHGQITKNNYLLCVSPPLTARCQTDCVNAIF